ncbi:SMI1/KNR4 family protein [Streptomyces sp. PSKA01]|uniref:SMI1/KNR4 family protein n=2 Tax=Streptomyces cupreus TaxID=2759956 RepID=A0A7X1MGW1_9ACTN|nr:SMI1/KNR4 family protein [Streptomyces cupreus]
MVEQAVRPIVQRMMSYIPAGWTEAVMYSRAGHGGSSVTGGYSPRRSGWGSGLPAPHEHLMALGEILRKQHGWEPVSMEIRCRPSGEYRLVAFHDAISFVTGAEGGFQVVLDPGHRLVQPGLRQEPGTATPAGDPESAVARFRTYLERRAAILGRPEELPPPATEAAIEAAEHKLGHRLPADLRALYLIADGGRDLDLFPRNAWLSLDSMVAEHTEWGADQRPWFGWDLEWEAVVFDTAPADTVRRCGGHPGWLRFGTSEDGNFLAVDMSPARDGRPGQVIGTGRDHDEGPAYVADSVTSLLGRCLELLEQGAYELHGGQLYLDEPGSEPETQQIIGGDLPDEVPATLQALHVNNVTGLVDLAPLSAAPRLRRLHLNRSTTADLTPIRDLPVESLRVTLDGGDLTPLTGHPHLASLGLTTTARVDLTPLRTVPHLHGLDLSGADIADPAVLADLPGLRYLALTADQWNDLLDGAGAPPGLAAAHLSADDATFDDALAWAARLGLDTDGAVRVSGSGGA